MCDLLSKQQQQQQQQQQSQQTSRHHLSPTAMNSGISNSPVLTFVGGQGKSVGRSDSDCEGNTTLNRRSDHSSLSCFSEEDVDPPAVFTQTKCSITSASSNSVRKSAESVLPKTTRSSEETNKPLERSSPHVPIQTFAKCTTEPRSDDEKRTDADCESPSSSSLPNHSPPRRSPTADYLEEREQAEEAHSNLIARKRMKTRNDTDYHKVTKMNSPLKDQQIGQSVDHENKRPSSPEMELRNLNSNHVISKKKGVLNRKDSNVSPYDRLSETEDSEPTDFRHGSKISPFPSAPLAASRKSFASSQFSRDREDGPVDPRIKKGVVNTHTDEQQSGLHRREFERYQKAKGPEQDYKEHAKWNRHKLESGPARFDHSSDRRPRSTNSDKIAYNFSLNSTEWFGIGGRDGEKKQKQDTFSSGIPNDPSQNGSKKNSHGMPPLGTNSLAAAVSVSSLFQHTQHSQNHQQHSGSGGGGGGGGGCGTQNFPSGRDLRIDGDDSNPSFPLPSSLAGSSMSIGNCLPPMLAAAAMAALTSGRFSGGSGVNQFNPLLSQTPGFAYPLHMMGSSADDTQVPLNTGVRGSGPFPSPFAPAPSTGGSSLFSQGSRGDLSSDLLFPPLRAMYNHSKALYESTLDRSAVAQTPPPPSLSASASPQPHSGRDNNKAMDAYNSMDDGCEDPDEVESLDGEVMEPESGTSSGGHQWTFEEQFKQLYVLSDDPKRKEFLDELFAYMQRRGTPVNRIPIMAKQVLDLYELFQLVVARGGLVEVINKKLWREITKGLNLPSSITSAAFTLRTQYMKYLYPYECDTLGLSTPGELQAAIDGNRREARRSSYSFDYPMMLAPGVARSLSPNSLVGNHSTNSAMAGAMNVTTSASNGGAMSGQNLSGTTPFSAGVSLSLPPGIPPLVSSSVPFGSNGLGFSSQMNQLHPLFGLPSGPLGNSSLTGLQASGSLSSSSQLGSGTGNLFSSNLIHPMASGGGFPLGTGGFPSFSAGISNSEEPLLTSTTQSTGPGGCMIPGIPNGFADTSAMAAAAATLFGAGFPTLPGAFATAPPQAGALTPNSIGRIRPHSRGAGRSNDSTTGRTTPNDSDAVETRGSMGQKKTSIRQRSHGSDDSDHSTNATPVPLNLTANDENSFGTMITRTPRNTEITPTESEKDESASPSSVLHSTGSLDRRVSSASKKAGGGNPPTDVGMRNTGREHGEGAEGENGVGDSDMNGSEIMRSGWSQTRENKILFPGFPASNSFGAVDADEAISKTAAQAACQQIWAAAAAAAASAGLHNGVGKMEEIHPERDHSPVNATLLHSNLETSSGRPSTTSSSSHTPSGKRSASRTPSCLDLPNSKVPKTTSSACMTGENFAKRYPTTGGQPMGRKSSSENRRTNDLPNVPPGLAGAMAQNGAGLGNINISMGTQNLKIQTQSGGPMGLPQNAMVVTMEFGNVLYQGVLFGQVRR